MKKTLPELHQEFLDQCRYSGKMRTETLRGYEACFRTFLKIFPEATVDILTPEVMTELFKRLDTRERVVGKNRLVTGIKNSTVATYRNKLNKFFKWLRDKGYLKNDPFVGLPYPSVSYSDRKYVEKEDAEKILAALAYNIEWKSSLIKRRNIALFSLLIYCGIRRGELIGLKLSDLDFDNRELTVRAETSKSKRNRIIPLNSMAVTALKEYLLERRKERYTTPYLWVSATGDIPFTVHGVRHLIKLVSEKSGVKFHAHRFRHTFAVNLLNNGTDIQKVKQLLGHSDIRMTGTYLRSMPAKSMQADVERLNVSNFL